LIVPLNPLRLFSVIVLVVEEPGERAIELGFAEMEKSPVVVDVTVTEIEMECDDVPLEPVTVTE
jgi:hypothetical protein